MPLRKPAKNASRKQKRAISSRNIAAEMRAGKSRKQAIAIGLSSAGLSKRKRRRKKK